MAEEILPGGIGTSVGRGGGERAWRIGYVANTVHSIYRM
jgi:hypothetical protein